MKGVHGQSRPKNPRMNADYISRNNFDAHLGESSEALVKEAFQRMDIQLDLSLRTAGVLEGWSVREWQRQHEQALSFLTCEDQTRFTYLSFSF